MHATTNYPETRIVKINHDSLVDCIEEALISAEGFGWTGWRIPIYLDEETGLVSSGNWLSNSSWQPDAHELPVKIESWLMSDFGYEGKEVDEQDIDSDNEEGNYTREDIRTIVNESIISNIIDALMERNQYEHEIHYELVKQFKPVEGTLKDFEWHHGKQDFTPTTDTVLQNVVLNHLDDEMKDSPELWIAEYTDDKGYTCIIAGDGSITSDGKYVMVKLS